MDIIGSTYTCGVHQLKETPMNTYFVRCIQADYSRLLTLGENLGAITLTYTEFVESTDENGVVTSTPTGTPQVTATEGGAWDYIGHIHQEGLVDSQGEPVYKPIADTNGNPYVHVNLVTPFDLGVVASNLSSVDEDVDKAWRHAMGKFFLLDAQGNARAPSAPHRVFL